MPELVALYWPHLMALTHLVIGAVAATHVLFTKREVRAAIGWVGIIILTPILGSVIYFVLGINRISQRRLRPFRKAGAAASVERLRRELEISRQLSEILEDTPQLHSQAALMDQLSGRQLEAGNAIEPLDGGDVAFPAMLQAIGQARRSIAMCSYIIDNDHAGRQFLAALDAACARGVQVRLLVDAVGSRYTFPPITFALKRTSIPFAVFMPTLVPWRFRYANLRNHRKILVVDGQVGFTGGMNIRGGCTSDGPRGLAVQDVHFRIEGPLVAHLWEEFFSDWACTTGERLEGQAWQLAPVPSARCNLLARGISAGPDRNVEKLRLALLGAIGSACRSIQIVTPYFLPDEALVTALGMAALRGVAVDLIVPQQNNLRLVQWASSVFLAEVLQQGCRVWESPPPFDHSKLMVVDDVWSFVGSANWDARSLRLNFELNVECYSECFARRIQELVEARRRRSRPLTRSILHHRHLLLRLRDRIAWLGSPYL